MMETSFDHDNFFDSKQSFDDDFFHDASDRLHSDKGSVEEYSGMAEGDCSLSQDSDEEGFSSSEFSYDEDSEEESHSSQMSEDTEDLSSKAAPNNGNKKDGNEEKRDIIESVTGSQIEDIAEEKRDILESGTGLQVEAGPRKDEEEVAKSNAEKDAIETAGKMIKLKGEGSFSLDENHSILENDNYDEDQGKTKDDAKAREELGGKEEIRVPIQNESESLAKNKVKVNLEGEETKTRRPLQFDETVKLKEKAEKKEEEKEDDGLKLTEQTGNDVENEEHYHIEEEVEKEDKSDEKKEKEDDGLKLTEQTEQTGNDVENEEHYHIKEEVEKEDKSDEKKEKKDNGLKLTEQTEQTEKLVTQELFLETDKEEKAETITEATSIESKQALLDDESRLESKESTGDTEREMVVNIQPEDDAQQNSEKEASVAKKEVDKVAIENHCQTKVEEECIEQKECPQDISKRNLGGFEGDKEVKELKNTTKTLKEGTSTMIQTELSLESENDVRLSNIKETESGTAPIVEETLNEEVMVAKDVKEDDEIANLNKNIEPEETALNEKDNMNSVKLYDIQLSQAEHPSINREEKTTCDRSLPGAGAIADGSSEKESTQLDKDKAHDTKRLNKVGGGGLADDDAALHEQYQKAASKGCGGCIMC